MFFLLIKYKKHEKNIILQYIEKYRKLIITEYF